MIKKLILLITILAFAFVSSSSLAQDDNVMARLSVGIIGGGGAGEEPCDAGTYDWSGDPQNESFETGSDGLPLCTIPSSGNAWVITEDNGEINTSDSAQSHCGSYSVSFTDAEAGSWDALRGQLTSDDGDFSVRLYFYVSSFEENLQYTFFRFLDSGVNQDTYFRIRRLEAPEHQFIYQNVATSYISFLAGAWYYFVIEYNQNATSKMKLFNAAGSQQTCTGVACNGNDLEWTAVDDGVTYLDIFANATGVVTVYYDDFYVSQADADLTGGYSCQ